MLDISLETDAQEERAVAAQLRDLLARFDTSRYWWTNRVRIAAGELPHSHPVLTVGTRQYDNEHMLLADFIHEQLHWYLDERDEQCSAAMSDVRRRFPAVPAGYPDGARDETSTYLHLVLCPLEHVALTDLLGDAAADRVRAFWQQDHYRWIYQTVEDDWQYLSAMLQRHELLPIALASPR